MAKPYARYPISNLFAQSDDKTHYARTLGYRGEKKVYVLDGKVISHRSVNWFDFCAALRKHERRSKTLLASRTPMRPPYLPLAAHL